MTALTFGPANHGYTPAGTFSTRFYSDKSEPYQPLASSTNNVLVSVTDSPLLATTDPDKRSEELAA